MSNHPSKAALTTKGEGVWQGGILSGAADRNFQKLNRNIGRKSRDFVAFWIGIRKSFLLDRNKSFQEQKTKMPTEIFSGFERINF